MLGGEVVGSRAFPELWLAVHKDLLRETPVRRLRVASKGRVGAERDAGRDHFAHHHIRAGCVARGKRLGWLLFGRTAAKAVLDEAGDNGLHVGSGREGRIEE